MERLKLRMNGFWYSVWSLTWATMETRTPPKNTCGYRFELMVGAILALLLLPITIYRVILRWIEESFDMEDELPTQPGVLGYLAPVLILTLFAITGLPFIGEDGVYKWYYMIYGFLILALATAILSACIWAITLVTDHFRDKKMDKRKRGEVSSGTIATLYDGWKNKYCTPIDWEK